MATSNFIDTATIWLHAGKGGDGAVTFHREKFVAAGGPDGGDGGRGGDIIFVADDNLSTLMDFRYKRKYTAPDGENGRATRMSGADGDDLVIRVPRGTVLKEAETDLVVADLTGSEPVVVAKGGRGGWGNSHFATPTRQIPKFAKPGLPGEDMHLKLELKVIADVGLIGFPNVGKSTLISIISAARPKIANYHFTTLTPVLGVVRVGPEQSFVCADIPGLIEGAAEGVGLGHDFLRHVERCRLLLHVVDVSGCEGRDPKADFEQINHELAGFSAELADRPQIVLGNKCDIATPEQVEEFKSYIEAQGLTFLPISAATRQGVDGLPALVYNRLKDLPPVKIYEAEYKRPDKSAQPTRPFTVERTGDHEFTVDDHRVLAGDLSAGGLDHPDAARRGAGQIARLTDLHPADIDGRKAVHILLRRNGVNNGLFVDLGGQRQLHQNTMDGGILRQLFHLGQQRLLRGVGGQVDAAALNAALRAVVDLAADIDLTGGVLAYQNDRQAGVDAPVFQLPDLFCGLGLRGCGQCLAVNDGCAHDTFPLSNIFFVRTGRAKRCQLLHQQHLSPCCKRLPVIPAGPLFLRYPRCSNPAHRDARSWHRWP